MSSKNMTFWYNNRIMKNKKNEFAKRFKELREENGFSQRSFGKLLNTTQTGISRWEVGSREPDIDTLMKIAEIFGCSVDYLIGYKDF